MVLPKRLVNRMAGKPPFYRQLPLMGQKGLKLNFRRPFKLSRPSENSPPLSNLTSPTRAAVILNIGLRIVRAVAGVVVVQGFDTVFIGGQQVFEHLFHGNFVASDLSELQQAMSSARALIYSFCTSGWFR